MLELLRRMSRKNSIHHQVREWRAFLLGAFVQSGCRKGETMARFLARMDVFLHSQPDKCQSQDERGWREKAISPNMERKAIEMGPLVGWKVSPVIGQLKILTLESRDVKVSQPSRKEWISTTVQDEGRRR